MSTIDEQSSAENIGARLRRIRRAKRITQQQVADQTGLSKSFVSAIELDHARPSIASIRRIAEALGVPLGVFFGGAEDELSGHLGQAEGQSKAPGIHSELEAGVGGATVVRKDRRKVIMWPGRDFRTYLLTPDLQRKLQVLFTEFEPGYEDDDDIGYTHAGEEMILVMSGIYEVTVDGVSHVLHEGDTIYYSSSQSHRTRVLSDVPVQALTVSTPPSF